MCFVYLGRLSQDGKVGLVAFATSLEDSDKVRVHIIVHFLPVHLQDDVPLTQLGTPWVVHDLFHHWAHGRLTCGGKRRMKEEKGKRGREKGERGEGRGGGGHVLVDLFAYACLPRLSHVLESNGNLPSTRLCEGTTFMRRLRTNSLGEGMLG